jgi:hypothetical protein
MSRNSESKQHTIERMRGWAWGTVILTPDLTWKENNIRINMESLLVYLHKEMLIPRSAE